MQWKLHASQKQQDFYKFQQCFRIEGLWVLQLSITNRQERESEQIMVDQQRSDNSDPLVNVILFSTLFHYGDWFWFSPYF
jgi:hypothetical protein